ncbi:MAG: hypothetical protein WD749_10645 [Phycisphaerales bacterium]
MDRTHAEAAPHSPPAPDAGAPAHDELQGVIADVERQLGMLRTYKTQHEEARIRWQQVERDLAQRQADLERRATELGGQREQLERDGAAAQQRDAELATRATALGERESRLTEQAAAVSRLREEAREHEAAVAQRERALAELVATFEARQKDAGNLRARVAGLEQDLASVRAELDRSGEAQGELIRSLSEREKKLQDYRQRRREAAAEAERRGAALAEAEKRFADLGAQVAERDGRLRDLAAKHGAATAKLREVSQGLREQSELVGRARQMEDELAARDARIAELEAILAEGGSGGPAEAVPDPALLAERETLRLRAESLEEQLLSTQSELQNAQGRLRSLQQRLSESRSGGALSPGAIPEEVGEAIVTRWRRLRLMRSLLREQADQVRQAGQAVRAKYEQADVMTREREALARERVSFAQQRTRAAVSAPRTPRARPAALVALAMAVLAGLSWALAGQVAPAVYAARATISVDPQATPSAGQLAEWQSYHEGLLRDPALTDLAAERLGRRGIVSLASPGALMKRMETDLSAESAGAGQITLELRGRGAAETVRTLDTYITALASQSNADRERRADGLGAVISQPPAVGSDAIEDPRLVYAGVIFALVATLSIAGGGLVWRRLASAKGRFERELADEATPDEWGQVPKTITRP